jgi:hypothetical protein
LPSAAALAKAGPSSESAMAILTVVLFIVAFLALNRYEFGRFD